MGSIYDQDMPRTAANHAALAPLDFIERAAQVYPERLAIVRVDGLHGQWQQAPAHAGHL